MKILVKFISFVLILIIISFIILLRVSSVSSVYGEKLYVYNWGEYIDPDLIEKFENEYHYDVIYETFDSNEAMYTKVKFASSPYDVIFPSDYMVQKLSQDDLLIKLDMDLLPNSKYISSKYLNPSFDPYNSYSLPYFWGTVGIVYNTTMTDLKFDSWNDLWDESLKNSIFLVDGAREAMGFSLNQLGYSLNSVNDKELRLAQENLFSLQPNVKAIIGDEMLQLMPQEEAVAAITWSGSANDMIDSNADLDFSIPQEGTNIFMDNMVIPTTSQNTKGAHEFINFMMEPHNAAQNAEWVGYSTPNEGALEYLENTDDERFYPSSKVLEKCEYYEYLGKDDTQKYNDLFLEFKMY